MKTIFSICLGISSIFQIFPLTVNETATLLLHHLLRLFNVCLLLKRNNWCLWKISALFLHTIFLLWRSIVTCNRCKIVSSHKCLSFNRRLLKFFFFFLVGGGGGGNISKLKGYVCFNFLRGRRADFQVHAILVLRLRTANSLRSHLKYHFVNQTTILWIFIH